MGPEDLREEYWKIVAAAAEALKEWDVQQLDPDGDWSYVQAAMDKLRVTIFGQVLGKKGRQ